MPLRAVLAAPVAPAAHVLHSQSLLAIALLALLLLAGVASTTASAGAAAAGELHRRAPNNFPIAQDQQSTTCFAKDTFAEPGFAHDKPVTSPALTQWVESETLPSELDQKCSSYDGEGCPLSPCVWFTATTQPSYRWFGWAYHTTDGYVFCEKSLQLDLPDGKGGRTVIKCDPRTDGTIIS